MKTLADLFALILAETEANKGKAVEYLFDINTQYNWAYMYQKVQGIEEVKTIFSGLSFETPEKLQLVYWTIYNNGRSGK